MELYDPATGAFGPTGPLAVLPPHPEGGKWWPRAPLAAIPLPDGHVLIPGKRCREEHTIVDGHGSEGYAPTPTEIYDPQTGTFSLGMPMPHCIGSATGLPDGKVFVTGWFYSPSEVDWSGLYDPTTGKTTMTGTPPGGKVVRLIDGRVLVIGWDATGTAPTTFLLSPEHANAP